MKKMGKGLLILLGLMGLCIVTLMVVITLFAIIITGGALYLIFGDLILMIILFVLIKRLIKNFKRRIRR